MFRCYTCCQENCGYTQCPCLCHPFDAVLQTPLLTAMADVSKPIPVAAIQTKCKAHPRYRVKRKPRSPCEVCWRAWIGRNQ